MKTKLSLIALCLLASNVFSQDVITTPNSFCLIYNFPEVSFYLQIEGKVKETAQVKNAFNVDGRFVQVICLKTSKFISDTTQKRADVEILQLHLNWEKDYLESMYGKKIDCKKEILKSKDSKDYLFWTYDMPIQRETTVTDTSITVGIQKQAYATAIVGKYIVGAYSPYIERDGNFDELKSFLTKILESITISEKFIEIEDLARKLNE